MPRPNKPRVIFAEDHAARRIAAERDARGWTNDGLAKRMTDAGCPMTASAIFKLEKGEPRRRIVVDELVTFAKVFGLTVDEMLLPPEIAARRELASAVATFLAKYRASHLALEEEIAAADHVAELLRSNRDLAPAVEDLIRDVLGADEGADAQRARRLAHRLTHPSVEDPDYDGPGVRFIREDLT